MFTPADYTFMAQALQLAARGRYSTSPNPRVGCIITKNNQVIAQGWHEKAGQPHAEINALRSTTEDVHGATAYITLEPCNHHGRTPPCAEALVHAGVRKVIIAMQDPNPLVSGSGCTLLQQAGIIVETGLLQDQAHQLNLGFIHRMKENKPWVRLKIAASLDGKTALNNGASQWITGEAARRDGHRWRARSCAILTGSGTLRHDDPQLTVRHIETSRQPKKVVVDKKLAIPLGAKLLQGENVIIFTACAENNQKITALKELGVLVIVLPDTGGKVNLVDMMHQLANLEINELLVEAGSGLNGALIHAGLVDELIIYLAPHLLGHVAQGMVNLPELNSLTNKHSLDIQDVRMIGQDIRITAKLHHH